MITDLNIAVEVVNIDLNKAVSEVTDSKVEMGDLCLILEINLTEITLGKEEEILILSLTMLVKETDGKVMVTKIATEQI